MGVTERREREREEVRRKILDAARDLFATEGYERVTMRRIADAIEYSATTIYHHFEDKDDLVEALCEEDFANLLRALQQEKPPADEVKAIRQLGRAYARFGLALPYHYRFMFMTAAKLENHGHSGSGLQAFSLLLAATERAIRSGRFRKADPLAAAQVLWASIHGAVALLVTYKPEQFPHAPAVPDLAERVIDNAIRGLLAAPSEAEKE
jgi:AcrR family transcriptional regulator